MAGRAQEELEAFIRPIGRAAVAFSGGVDSSVVAAAAVRTLGRRNCALVVGRSPSLAGRELRQARVLAREIGGKVLVVDCLELENPTYAKNPADRCYFCKDELFSRVRAAAGDMRILDGTNADDDPGARPGMRAVAEAGVVSPLAACGIGKAATRRLAREYGLPNWDKPAAPCLSSRFAPGTPITSERLGMVERAEDYLLALVGEGTPLRVRYNADDSATIVVPRAKMGRIVSGSPSIERRFLKIGFKRVGLALTDFRSC